jgi:hypothetical protein
MIKGSICTHPFDIIKTRLQLSESFNYKGITNSIVLILKEEGIKTFFVGFVPRCVKRSLTSGITRMIYEKLKKFI